MREHPSSRIDLRSDTITQPTTLMRREMHHAIVGDDVLGDDPTVIQLEETVATMFGKEAGLFVASGTMSNAIAIKAHTNPGDEVITERYSHIYLYEGGGYAALSGCSISLVEASHGLMTPENVEKSIRKSQGSGSHFPNGTLVCVENTSNRGGGTCYGLSDLDAIAEVAGMNACKSHIDGARIFNASIATGESVERICRGYDSVSICLSKGLGAPVGSVLVGTQSFIDSAHRWRKMFGGGWRQAGILAAAGLYALDNHVQRLDEDHKRAKVLAESINSLPNFQVDLSKVQTNMIYVQTKSPAAKVVEALAEHEIDAFDLTSDSIRLVTHLHITDEDVARVMHAFGEIQ
mgnify:CR=1 FL=1